jgi:hypothetical protein
MTLREQYFSELYRGYLQLTVEQLAALTPGAPFALSSAAVWPANASVPRLCPHDDAEASIPCMAIVADEQPSKHPHIMEIAVDVRLQVGAQVDTGSPDPHGTPMATAQAWLQAITEALYAKETFRAYLLSLTEAQRTGGEIMLRTLESGVTYDHDKEERTHTWEVKVNHKVNVEP